MGLSLLNPHIFYVLIYHVILCFLSGRIRAFFFSSPYLNCVISVNLSTKPKKITRLEVRGVFQRILASTFKTEYTGNQIRSLQEG